MKKQGYNDRLDDSLGSKNGKKTQSMKSRRDESEGMEKSKDKGKFSGNKSSSPTAYSKKKGPMATSAERYDAKNPPQDCPTNVTLGAFIFSTNSFKSCE